MAFSSMLLLRTPWSRAAPPGLNRASGVEVRGCMAAAAAAAASFLLIRVRADGLRVEPGLRGMRRRRPKHGDGFGDLGGGGGGGHGQRPPSAVRQCLTFFRRPDYLRKAP
jgi:hypothetical protein